MARILPEWPQDLPGALHALREELNRAVGSTQLPQFFGLNPSGSAWLPPVDVSETNDEVRVLVDLPGVAGEAVELTVDGALLTIQGRRPAPPAPAPEATARREHLSERPGGPFHRQLALPCEVNLDAVRAEMRDGVLEIVLPKSEALRPRAIPIRVG